MSAAHLYEFATVYEDAIASILTDGGFNVVTSRTAAQLQKIRPRVEIEFQLGTEKKSYHIISGTPRNATWFSLVNLLVVTNANDAGVNHRTYRAGVQNLMAAMKNTLNTGSYANAFGTHAAGDAYLDYHQVQLIAQTGNVVEYKPENGIESSRITFSLEQGIQLDAWAELSTS